ncbi:MAG: hypothetical protein ACRD1T_11490, partial [Acidimicrobiia bacterium]
MSQLTEAVNRAQQEVEQMRDRQDRWQQEQIKADAEDHARDIENNWKPKLDLAEMKASMAEKNLLKELDRPTTISPGEMAKISYLFSKGVTVCH